jgi:hypothetical protein
MKPWAKSSSGLTHPIPTPLATTIALIWLALNSSSGAASRLTPGPLVILVDTMDCRIEFATNSGGRMVVWDAGQRTACLAYDRNGRCEAPMWFYTGNTTFVRITAPADWVCAGLHYGNVTVTSPTGSRLGVYAYGSHPSRAYCDVAQSPLFSDDPAVYWVDKAAQGIFWIASALFVVASRGCGDAPCSKRVYCIVLAISALWFAFFPYTGKPSLATRAINGGFASLEAPDVYVQRAVQEQYQ